MKDVSQKREPKHFQKFEQAYLKEQISNWRVSITKLQIEDIKYFVNFASKRNSILNDSCQLILSLQNNQSYFVGYAFETDGFPYDQHSHPIFKDKISFNNLHDVSGQGSSLTFEFDHGEKPWKFKFVKKDTAQEWMKLMHDLKNRRFRKAADIMLGKKSGKIDGLTEHTEDNEQYQKLPEDKKLEVDEPNSPISPINIMDVDQKEDDASSETGSMKMKNLTNNLSGLLEKVNTMFSPRTEKKNGKSTRSEKCSMTGAESDREDDIGVAKIQRKQSLSATSPGLRLYPQKVENEASKNSESRVSSSFEKPTYQELQKGNKDLMLRFIQKNNEIQDLKEKVQLLERQNEERILLRKESKEDKEKDVNEELVKLRVQLKDQKKKDEELRNIIKELQQQKAKNTELLHSMRKMEKKMVSLKFKECSTPETFNVVLKNLQNNVNNKMDIIKTLTKENQQLRQMVKHKKSRKMSWNELWLQQSKKIPEVPEPDTPTIIKSVDNQTAASEPSKISEQMAESAPN